MMENKKILKETELEEIDLDIKNNLLTAMDDLIATISIQVRNRMKNTIIHPSTIMQVTKFVMEAVENSPIKGSERKKLALRTICELVIDAPLQDEKERECLIMVISGVIGDAIDLIIAGTRGKLNLNLEAESTSCSGRCFKVVRKHRNSNPNF